MDLVITPPETVTKDVVTAGQEIIAIQVKNRDYSHVENIKSTKSKIDYKIFYLKTHYF